MAVVAAVEDLKETSKPATTRDAIDEGGAISTNSDHAIDQIISEAMGNICK